MILIIHQKTNRVIEVLKNGVPLEMEYASCTAAFWDLAEKYPDRLIVWCEEKLVPNINILEICKDVFHHDLIMASYAVNTEFLPDNLGYIDQLPFINVKQDVLYGTWKMSSDVGGIKGKVLLRFKPLLKNVNNFEYLLNSIGKLGQQNSLFCYSAPQLLREEKRLAFKTGKKLPNTASNAQTFQFVFQHYNTIWSFILLWSLLKYEKRFPILSFLTLGGKRKYFQKKVDLSQFAVQSSKISSLKKEIDVVIPTMGRPQFLYDVLKDFAAQTHLPKKVIIVEQDPDENAISQLQYLTAESWPFEIVHLFIHQTGACNARNLGLKNVTSEWVFLSDDDQRFQPELIELIFSELQKYGVDGLTTSYLQRSEKKIFEVPKQWGTFGAGNSIVKSTFTQNLNFDITFEHGYGEDVDYGMQLRDKGCDIIYHSGLEITHLKAPVGGFRQKPLLPWEQEEPVPKPSPTLMVFALKHYTVEQIKGFRISLFLKFYRKQKIKNPVSYLKQMKKRWRRSEYWAEKLFSPSIGGTINQNNKY